MKVELEGMIKEVEHKLSSRMDRLEMKFNLMILLLIIALTLMNPLAVEVVKIFVK